MNEHICQQIKEVNLANPAALYSYKWTDQGWCLHYGGDIVPQTDVWCVYCQWCCKPLPVIGLIESMSQHRCTQIIQMEWGRKSQDDESSYLIAWDGYEWIYSDNGTPLIKRLQHCPFCKTELPDPRIFINKVAIA